MTIPDIKTAPELLALIDKSVAAFKALSPEEQELLSLVKIQNDFRKEQIRSYLRGEMAWPKAKYQWIDGVKVYASYEDFCND